MTKIFVIGSCRIWRPLRPFHADGSIVLTNMRDPQWFTHTSRAAMQFVESAVGKRQIPEHLHQLIVETTPADRIVDFEGRQAIQGADFILIEVSSLKSFDSGGFELNQHRVLRAGMHFPPTRIGRNDVFHHLDAIEQMTGKPLALVDHIPFDLNGEVIPARKEIADILEASGRRFISKMDFMQPDWLEDINHHRKESEAEIGRLLLSRLGVSLTNH